MLGAATRISCPRRKLPAHGQSGQCSFVQPLAARQPHKEQHAAHGQLKAHGEPHAHQPKVRGQQGSEGEPDAPHADEVQHKAPGAVARALHGTAGHDAGTEHRLGQRFNAQHLRTQRDDRRVGRENAHQLRRKNVHANAGQRHDAHAHAGAQPGKALGHIPAVRAHGLAHQGKGGVLDAVASHIAQALGADAQAVGRNGGGAQTRHDADEQHLCRRKGRTLCGQRCAHLPQVLQAGFGDAPGSGLADAQRAVPQQQDSKGQHAADDGGQSGAQCGTRHAEACAPDGHAVAEQLHLPGGVDEEEVEDHVQHAGQHADEARRQGVAGRAQHGGIGAHGHGKGQGSGPDGKVGRGICLQRRVRAQPPGQEAADADAEGCRRAAHHEIEDHGLAQHAPGIVLPVGTQILRHLNGKGHVQARQHPVQQPGAGADDADGCRGRRTDVAHHGRVDVLHGRDHDLLQDGRDAQREHHLQGVPQRHLFAPAHLRRKLFERDGHRFSLYNTL